MKAKEFILVESDYKTEKQILTRIRQIQYDRKQSGTDSNAGELNRLKQQLKNMRSGQGVTENDDSDNFTIDDIKRLEKIRDFETLKAQAKFLIKGKPARRMKPEKISFFYNRIDSLKNPMAVIKLMYDLLLAGEGNKVIGSRHSMNPNTYRQRFGENDVSEGSYSNTPTEKLQSFWNSHKDETRPSPVLANQLRQVAAELKRRKQLDVSENEMDTPEFQRALASLKKQAAQGPKKTVYDPKTGKYKVVPVNPQGNKNG